jgi:hypothetical protein
MPQTFHVCATFANQVIKYAVQTLLNGADPAACRALSGCSLGHLPTKS